MYNTTSNQCHDHLENHSAHSGDYTPSSQISQLLFIEQFFHVGCFFLFVRGYNFCRSNVISQVQNSKRLINVRMSREFLFTWWGLSGTANSDLCIHLLLLEPPKDLKWSTALLQSNKNQWFEFDAPKNTYKAFKVLIIAKC